MIVAAAGEIESNRELPAELVAALQDAGLFRMLLPRSLGGQEVTLPLYAQALQEIAKADASTAWCVAQTSVCSTISASLDHEVAWEIFGKDPHAVLAWGPGGSPAKAIPTEGGYRISGTWGFASGSRHANWLAAHCPVFEPDGTQRKDAHGQPVQRTFVVPKSTAVIADTWQVIGLKGTGSDTYTITDLFVPDARSMTGFAINPAERRERGPLYRFTVFQMFPTSFATIALGIARTMLNDFIALAKTKTPGGNPTGTRTLLRDNAVVQSQVGVAESELAASRVFLLHAVEDLWREAEQDGAISLERRMALRMACSHASHHARQVADMVYHAAGATAIFERNPFERRFRDIHTVSQQVQSHFAVYEAIGQHFLGLPLQSRLV